MNNQRGLSILIPLGMLGLAFVVGNVFSESDVRYSRTDAVFRHDGWADSASCGECHEQAEEFDQTGHAQTLLPATAPHSVQLLQMLEDSDIGQKQRVTIDAAGEQLLLARTTESGTTRAAVGWCVGSGTHARTWVSILPDSMGATDLLEYRWTWFRDGQDFAVTPGHPDVVPPTGAGCLGLQFDGPRAVRCFSCHATRLGTREDRVDEAHLVAGVRCQRCHGPRGEHVASGGEITNDSWRFEDREESVRRCGQCHRNAEEFTAEELRPNNTVLPRFQPVGLTQSSCYLLSELSCTSCHDPHKPLSAQDSLGDWQCVQCHSPEHNSQTLCAAGHSADCVRCHMPKVRQPDSPLKFTDHWIRIRKEAP
ncbi:MAG: cytochrome c3 family protein [Planctomycetaceae bacterium]|nr:cytochrome c3 family protein [Planctomycetaceae bacterium]